MRSAVLSAQPNAEGARHGAHGIRRCVGRCVGQMCMQPDESCNRHPEVGALEGAAHRDEGLARVELQAQLRQWAVERTGTAADAALASSERRRGRQVCEPVCEVRGGRGGRRSTGC